MRHGRNSIFRVEDGGSKILRNGKFLPAVWCPIPVLQPQLTYESRAWDVSQTLPPHDSGKVQVAPVIHMVCHVTVSLGQIVRSEAKTT
jgi:hypothetical protein